MPFLGDRFRAAREARGLSLADVSEHIHIRALYLDCIEREDFASIGAPVYTRGFVRSYARFLGLDAEEAVREYGATAGTSSAAVAVPATARTVRDAPPARRPSTPPPPPRTPGARAQQPRRGGGPSAAIWILGFIALVLIGAVGYTFWSSQQPARAPDAAVEQPPATAAPVAVATPRPAATPSARTLAFTITQRAWVQIALDGQAPVAAMLDPGTTKVFHGKTATLRVGNAGGVNVTVDGKSLGPLGASGAVVERTFEL